MLRGILAIVAGYLIFAVSAVALFAVSGRDPHAPQPAGFVVIVLLYGIGFAGVSGYVTALIAKRADTAYVVALASIIALGALVSLFASPASHAIWSQVGTLVLMVPAALLGGIIRVRRARN
jgi:hypothetical protein